MITLRIRIKTEGKTYVESHFLDEGFNICKNNEELFKLVEKATNNAAFDTIDEVKITANFEW